MDEKALDKERVWSREIELIKGWRVEEVVGCLPVKGVRVVQSGGGLGGSASGGGSLNNDGSTGSNSPRPDAKVFVPAAATQKAVGTIGQGFGGKKGPQSPVANGVVGGGNGR